MTPVDSVSVVPALRRRSPLRVLFVIPGEAQGCSMIFARREISALNAQGVQVYAFHLRSRTSPWILYRELRRLRRERDRVRPHVVHAQFGTVTALFSALGAGRIPLVITYRGSDLNPAPGTAGERLRGWLARGFSQIAALAATQIVCVSAHLRKRLLWRRSWAAVLPSGVDPVLFSPRPRDESRSELGWPFDVPVVLFNAGYNPRIKRLDLAKAAVARARRALPGLRLEVLDGGCSPDRVPLFMNAADCLLVTSAAEGSPTVVKEALACNLPVVSVSVGDVAERLRGVSATRVVGDAPQALANALIELLAFPMRSDGRRKLNEFSSDRMAAEMCAIYRRVATAPRRMRRRSGSVRDRERGCDRARAFAEASEEPLA